MIYIVGSLALTAIKKIIHQVCQASDFVIFSAVYKDSEIEIPKLLRNYQQNYDDSSRNRELTVSFLTVPLYIIAKIVNFLEQFLQPHIYLYMFLR